MGVFGVFFGCRGVIGFNGCCSGVSSGDGGFTLACVSGCSGDGGFTVACVSGCSGDGGFTVACIGGRRGVIGFKVATWLCPAREIVRPANEKWHKIGVLWRAERRFSRMAREGPSFGELVVPRCRARTTTQV